MRGRERASDSLERNVSGNVPRPPAPNRRVQVTESRIEVIRLVDRVTKPLISEEIYIYPHENIHLHPATWLRNDEPTIQARFGCATVDRAVPARPSSDGKPYLAHDQDPRSRGIEIALWEVTHRRYCHASALRQPQDRADHPPSRETYMQRDQCK